MAWVGSRMESVGCGDLGSVRSEGEKRLGAEGRFDGSGLPGESGSRASAVQG